MPCTIRSQLTRYWRWHGHNNCQTSTDGFSRLYAIEQNWTTRRVFLLTKRNVSLSYFSFSLDSFSFSPFPKMPNYTTFLFHLNTFRKNQLYTHPFRCFQRFSNLSLLIKKKTRWYSCYLFLCCWLYHSLILIYFPLHFNPWFKSSSPFLPVRGTTSYGLTYAIMYFNLSHAFKCPLSFTPSFSSAFHLPLHVPLCTSLPV